MTGELPDHLLSLALIAVGGGLGSVARLWVSEAVTRRYGAAFPWGTLAVNVSGAAAIGALAAVLLSPEAEAFETALVWSGLVIGLLGGYTTVSSFAWQTLALARNGQARRALANIGLSLGLCLTAAKSAWVVTLLALKTWGAP